MAKYSIKDIYQGGYSTLKPEYGDIFTGYRASVSSIGVSTDPRSPLILNEISAKIAPGQKTMELSLIQPNVFDAIPKQHLKEANRMAKLTGVNITIHGPLLEPSGIMGQQGFSEASRQAMERQMNLAVERSHEISPDGNVPVTFHSSTQLPAPEISKVKEEGEMVEKIGKFSIIDKDTGQMQQSRLEPRHYPDNPKVLEKGELEDLKEELNTINRSHWSNALTQMILNKDRADEIISQNFPIVHNVYGKWATGQIKAQDLPASQRQALSRIQNAEEFIKDTQLNARSLFNKAWKLGDEKDRKELKKLSEDYSNAMYEKDNQGNIIEHRKEIVLNPKAKADLLHGLIVGLEKVNPKQFELLDDFAKEKSAETFGNVAFNAYKKFGNKAPIVSIENPPSGMGLARGQDLKDVVEASRKQFIEKAKKEGISENEAKKAAEKLIGVTWDVGHINMLRKFGFEGKDIVKESEKVAPFIKHVHLSDNFGMEHTELPMGMGNVPFKEIMKKLGKKGFEAKKIIEAGDWWQHFKISPVSESFQAMGSPIYSMQMQPYWNQAVGLQQGYFGGYGAFLPTVNYETWGAGFSNLPQELGGQKPGAQGSRMSGRGME